MTRSPALSLLARPGDGGIRTRKVAILVANGVDGGTIEAVKEALLDEGAVPRLVGVRLGKVSTADGESLEADASMENSPAVLFDALVLPDGADAVTMLLMDGHTLEYVKDTYRHCKTIIAFGASSTLLERCGIPVKLPSGTEDPGIIMAPSGDGRSAINRFIKAVGRHRHPERDSDPPLI